MVRLRFLIPANECYGQELGRSALYWIESNADVAQLVEHHLAKVRVAGSNPVVRSKESGSSVISGVYSPSNGLANFAWF